MYLKARWNNKENDLVFSWPSGISTKSDARYLSYIFDKELMEELTKRGYDVKTLKFSILPDKDNDKFNI